MIDDEKNIKIIDIVSTSQGAYRLLRTRVTKLNKEKNIINAIMCPYGEYNEKIKNLGINVIQIDLSRGLNPFKIMKEIREIERRLLEEKPDFIHTHNSKTGALGRIAANRLNKKFDLKIRVIHQVHGFYFTQFKYLKKAIYKYVEYNMSKKTDVLLFQNYEELKIAQKMGMDKNCKLLYIGNGIPFEEFKPYIEKKKETNEHEKIICCIARLESVKNQEMIIKSLDILENKFHFYTYKMYFIGEGNQEKFKDLINKFKLKANFIFTGPLDREDVIKILLNSDLSVLTSYKEGKPRALMESSALGVPIVATDVIGTREVVKNGKTGYLVKLNDYESFAEKMFELLTNEKKWTEFSKNAKEVAAEEFNEDNVVRQLKELYYSIKNNNNYNRSIASTINK